MNTVSGLRDLNFDLLADIIFVFMKCKMTK